MRIVFKVPAEKRAAAAEAVNYLDPSIAEGPCFNPDQALVWNETEGTLTFVGQRHPLHQDGAYDAILEVFGSVVEASKALVEYSTSDPRLEWWQVLEDLPAQMTDEQLREAIGDLSDNEVAHPPTRYHVALLEEAESRGFRLPMARLRRAVEVEYIASTIVSAAAMAVRHVAQPYRWAPAPSEADSLQWILVNLGRLETPYESDEDRRARVRRRIEDALRKGVPGWEAPDQLALVLGLARILGVRSD